MAVIKPFKALRFTHFNEAQTLICPPYDIVSEKERKQLLARNPHNIIRLELPVEGGEQRYAQAGDLLKEWLAQDVLRCDDTERLYLYQQGFVVEGANKRVTGLVCRAQLHAFSEGVILPHEETLSKAKEDRLRLMEATACNFSSIYSLFFDAEGKAQAAMDEVTATPAQQTVTDGDGVTHSVWQLTNPAQIAALQEILAPQKLYIADGHHRYETALNYRHNLQAKGKALLPEHPANSILMTLMPMESSGLVVLPTHRIVHHLPAFDAADFLAKCAQYFAVEPLDAAANLKQALESAAQDKSVLIFCSKHHTAKLILEHPEALARLLPHACAATRGLDVSALHTLLLEDIMGLDKKSMAAQTNLTYTRNLAEATAAVAQGHADCAFLLNPTKVEEIAGVAAAGEKMPQKSTYFYPKLITGLLMNSL